MQPSRPSSSYPPAPAVQPGGSAAVWAIDAPNEARVLQGYVRVLYRNKWVVVVLACLGLLAGLGLSRMQARVFHTSASVEIQGLNGDYLNLRSFDPTTAFQDYSPEGEILTQAKIMERNALRERVIAVIKARSSRKDAAFSDALDYAANHSDVHLIAGTHILELECDSTDGQVAADYSNVWADEYINDNRDSRMRTTQQTEEALRNQLDTVKEKLEQADAAMLAYARNSNLMFTGEDQSNVTEVKLRHTQEALTEAEKERIAKQAEQELIAGTPKESLPAVLEDPAIREEQARLEQLRSQLAELKTFMAPGHAKIIRLEAQIAELEGTMKEQRGRLITRVNDDFQAARRKETLLQQSYDAQSLIVADQAQKKIQYNILKRDADTSRALYESLLQKVKEAGVSKAMRVGNVRLVEPALPPLRPYRPRVLANALMGLMAGLFLGIAFIAVRERVDYNIRVPGESPACLQVPELGAVPSAGGGNKIRPLFLSGQAISTTRPAITDAGLESPVADSFRAILASLLFSPRTATPSIELVITSPGPGEGKSTVISNLGLAMAETGRRVLLIDGDLRSPRLHEIFGIPNRQGLTDLLSEDVPPEAAKTRIVRVTPNSGLYVLPAGDTSGNVSNLLYSVRVPRLLQDIREDFDAVLIDSPPMMHAPDARVLARVAGAAVLVIRAGKTSRDTASAARQRFADDGTPVIGTILNDWNLKESNGIAYQRYVQRNGYIGSNGRA